MHFDYRAITFWGQAFQLVLLYVQFFTFRVNSVPTLLPLFVPQEAERHGYLNIEIFKLRASRGRPAAQTGLGSSPFARRYFGNNDQTPILLPIIFIFIRECLLH